MKTKHYVAGIGLIGFVLLATNMGCSSSSTSTSSTPKLTLYLNVGQDLTSSLPPAYSYAIYPVAVVDPACIVSLAPRILSKFKWFGGAVYAAERERSKGESASAINTGCAPITSSSSAPRCFFSIAGGVNNYPPIGPPSVDGYYYNTFGADMDPFYDYANNIVIASHPSTDDYLLYTGEGATFYGGAELFVFNNNYFHCNSGDVVTVTASCYTAAGATTASQVYSCT